MIFKWRVSLHRSKVWLFFFAFRSRKIASCLNIAWYLVFLDHFLRSNRLILPCLAMLRLTGDTFATSEREKNTSDACHALSYRRKLTKTKWNRYSSDYRRSSNDRYARYEFPFMLHALFYYVYDSLLPKKCTISSYNPNLSYSVIFEKLVTGCSMLASNFSEWWRVMAGIVRRKMGVSLSRSYKDNTLISPHGKINRIAI